MRTVLFFLIVLLFTSCGYKPSSQFARGVIGKKVYATVEIYIADPENAVIIKDALFQALLSRFRVSVVKEIASQTHLDVRLSSLSFSPIEYDENGYVVAKRATVHLSIKREKNQTVKNYAVSGTYDFAIEPNGLVSDTERFKAIKEASLKAIDGFVTKLAVEGAMV